MKAQGSLRDTSQGGGSTPSTAAARLCFESDLKINFSFETAPHPPPLTFFLADDLLQV